MRVPSHGASRPVPGVGAAHRFGGKALFALPILSAAVGCSPLVGNVTAAVPSGAAVGGVLPGWLYDVSVDALIASNLGI